MMELPFVRRLWLAIERRHPGLDPIKKVKALVRDGIGTMVGDVMEETQRRVREAGVQSIDDVRGFGSALVGFSGGLAVEERQLKSFLYERLYNSAPLTPVRKEAQRVIAGLAQYYLDNPASLPSGWQRGEGEVARQRGIADYIAGMTDRFAIARHEELVGPVHLPDRF